MRDRGFANTKYGVTQQWSSDICPSAWSHLLCLEDVIRFGEQKNPDCVKCP